MYKVAIFQPIIPKYRVPVYEQFGAVPEIQLTIYAGGDMGSLSSVNTADNYNIVSTKLYNFKVFGSVFRWQKNLIKTVLFSDFELVILSWDIRYIQLPILMMLSIFSKKKLVLWGHGYSKKPNKYFDNIRNFLGKTADGVIVYSSTIANRLIKENKFNPKKVFVAQNTVCIKEQSQAIKYWQKNEQALSQFQKNNQLNPNSTIIFVSRLEEDNKIELLISAMEKILKYKKDAKLVIVGKGSHKEVLESFVKDRNIESAIVFTGAIYDEMKLAPWMLSSKVFCYPVNIGLSIIHAFSYGLPVITSDDIDSHNPEIEILTDKKNGLLYEDGNIEDIVDKCLFLMNQDEIHKAMSINAKKIVCEKYTVDNMVDGFINTLNLLKVN